MIPNYIRKLDSKDIKNAFKDKLGELEKDLDERIVQYEKLNKLKTSRPFVSKFVNLLMRKTNKFRSKTCGTCF